MATTNFKGQPVKLIGEFIQVGKVADDFELVKTDLSSFSLKDLNGKNVILNIFPSLDTSVCATSVRKFNKMAAGLKDTVVLAISKDLPFAHGRFCTTEGIENVIPFRRKLRSAYGRWSVSRTFGACGSCDWQGWQDCLYGTCS